MNLFFIIVVLIVIVLFAYRIAHMFTSNAVKANDDYFEQAGVRVDFNQKTITIKGKTYDVNKVTGITTVTTSGGKGLGDALRSTVGVVEISIDDFKRPVHRIPVSGGKSRSGDFSQRLCVAIRKAGGADFH